MNSTFFKKETDYSGDLSFSAAQNTESHIKLTIPDHLIGMRLDVALTELLPDYSRNRLSTWIKNGAVTVNNRIIRPKDKVIGGESIILTVYQNKIQTACAPEPIHLNIIYEDDTVIVLNKPAGLVVHPAAGNWNGTLLNGLLAHCPALDSIPRAGIVHRLDKDTSGLMVVAKTLFAQNHLVRQLQSRTVKRIYRAVADGIVPFNGKIDAPIGRHPHNRLKMSVVKFGGKQAVTYVNVLERYLAHSYIECTLETGRTHQIRVHMREANHPLAGDTVYGNLRHACSDAVKTAIKSLARQALHAYRLGFIHPLTKENISFEAPIPQDIYYLLSVLRLEAGLDSPLGCKLSENTDDWNEHGQNVTTIYVRD